MGQTTRGACRRRTAADRGVANVKHTPDVGVALGVVDGLERLVLEVVELSLDVLEVLVLFGHLGERLWSEKRATTQRGDRDVERAASTSHNRKTTSFRDSKQVSPSRHPPARARARVCVCVLCVLYVLCCVGVCVCWVIQNRQVSGSGVCAYVYEWNVDAWIFRRSGGAVTTMLLFQKLLREGCAGDLPAALGQCCAHRRHRRRKLARATRRGMRG